jgi:glycosyltransferase involved in cell wall biosynthesis
MAVYNGEKYLPEAIDSILSQTFTNFEFIIINDGSTDKSKDIILSYIDKRIRLIDNEENIGLTKSLNIGIKLAKGKYIARMDADDVSLPKRFEIQYKYMEENPDIDICGSRYMVLGQNKIKELPTNPEFIKILLFQGINPIAHPSVIMRKKSLDKHNIFYNEKYRFAQDFALWASSYNVLDITNTPDILLKLRIHDLQTTQIMKTQQKETINQICIEQLSLLGIKPNKKTEEVHLCHINNSPLKNLKQVELSEQWLLRLKHKNDELEIFTKSLFKHLIEQWRNQKYTNYFVKKSFKPKIIMDLYNRKYRFFKRISLSNQLRIIIKSTILWKTTSILF